MSLLALGAVLAIAFAVVALVGAVLFGLWQGRKTKGPEAGPNAKPGPRNLR